MEPSAHSHAYESLVENPDDIVGMIAYCAYKAQKRELCMKHSLQRDDPRVAQYHFDLNDGRIGSLRNDATVTLRNYSNSLIGKYDSDERQKIVQDVFLREIKYEVRRGTSWWKAIIYSAIGGAVLGFVIIGAAKLGFMNPFSAFAEQQTVAKP